jgi:hypothetical protein
LFERAREATAHADARTNPSCHALAHALEGALDAEFTAIKNAERAPADVTGIEPPPVSHVRVAKPTAEN